MKKFEFRSFLFCFLIVFTLNSCVTTPNIRNLSPEARGLVGQIKVTKSTLPAGTYKMLGTIDGISCRSKSREYTSKIVTEDEAIYGLKLKAAELGANAVINIVCRHHDVVDYINNCWEKIVCVGDAVKIADSGPFAASKGGKKSEEPVKSKNTVVGGTGWFVSPGFVVTNQHVIHNKSKFTLVTYNKQEIPAKVVVTDKFNDLALLAPLANANLPPAIPLCKSVVKAGEPVFTIGYPMTDLMGTQGKITDGIVSAITGLQDDPRVYQTTVSLQQGNSGGPLLNMNGEAIGIVTSKLNAVKVFQWSRDLPQNVNYAVKTAYLQALISAAESPQIRIEELKPMNGKKLTEVVERTLPSVVIVVAE